MEPFAEAALIISHDTHDRLRKLVQGSDAEVLNWRPTADETNSIWIMVNHALNSERWWIARAVGIEVERYETDRAAEFRLQGSDPGRLLRRIDQADADAETYLGQFTPSDFRRQLSRPDSPEPASGAWAVIHAIEHVREHLGQAELTLQIWEGRRSSATPR